MTAPLPVHPFPARMAPGFALSRLPEGGKRRHILDPMMGSGTIPVLASVRGHTATGFDLDPLALLIARAWGRPLDEPRFLAAAKQIAADARTNEGREVIFADDETTAFVERWFDEVARGRLGALAAAIDERPNDLKPALWCAFSRLIITKEVGASLARDVSHSRPHRVRDTTDFDPIARFERSAREVQRRHAALAPGRVGVETLTLDNGDARELPVEDGSVDLIMTSPPYLIAIDYLRGHRMSLVWMGYTVAALRELRGEVIGTERGLRADTDHDAIVDEALGAEPPPRSAAILRRWLVDMHDVLSECRRVLKPSGSLSLLVADATLFGVSVRLSELIDRLASDVGFKQTEKLTRELPADRRYLPPPAKEGPNHLDKRMRHEVCLSYAHS